MRYLKPGKTAALILLSAMSLAACKEEGEDTFRYDTFGDEALWTDVLRWNEVITTVDPMTALSVGLKVDSAALPPGLLQTADLTDPATTLELLKLDAVVGIKASVESDGTVSQFGVTCALCHSTVDDSVAPGIGQRLDGWPARDLDPGLIISLSPFFDDKPRLRAELQSWGKGKYDPFWNQDGISDPVLIPPAYGLKKVKLATYTGEGDISFWNAYVAITQMGGQGNFKSEALGLDITADPDLVSDKLESLKEYQHSLEAPSPVAGSYDVAAAKKGKKLFRGKASCSSCHRGKNFTDGKRHGPEQTGSDPAYAMRGSHIGAYRTAPLKGIGHHAPYFHNGAHASLEALVEHYDEVLLTGLTNPEKADLVEYLKSL
jgi:mono/diheme cytochrome c family protein